jgi:glutathione S-transferase
MRVFVCAGAMIIYHLVPRRFYEKQRKNAVYLPKPFAQDGFIHCTRKADEMARVANRFYKRERGPHVYLYIDTRRLKARLRYDDPEQRYPHIYGGLNHDAVIAIKPARRDEKGNFIAPEPL